MFAEILVVILLWSRLDLARFVKALFMFYVLGVLGSSSSKNRAAAHTCRPLQPTSTPLRIWHEAAGLFV
jgi:hypothetical protein